MVFFGVIRWISVVLSWLSRFSFLGMEAWLQGEMRQASFQRWNVGLWWIISNRILLSETAVITLALPKLFSKAGGILNASAFHPLLLPPSFFFPLPPSARRGRFVPLSHPLRCLHHLYLLPGFGMEFLSPNRKICFFPHTLSLSPLLSLPLSLPLPLPLRLGGAGLW